MATQAMATELVVEVAARTRSRSTVQARQVFGSSKNTRSRPTCREDRGRKLVLLRRQLYDSAMSDIKTGPEGPRGERGHDDELPVFKFNAADVADNTVQYLTDFGRYTIVREYPIATRCEFHSLAVNLLRFVVPPGGSIVAVVLKNGAPVDELSVTYSPGQTGVLLARGRKKFSAGDTFDLQVTTSGLGSATEISATIGVRKDR
jgi:hypothetical protein